jgi:hypothetical protein
MQSEPQTTNWQPPETVPKDRIVLIKTKTGIVSGQYFPGESTYHHEFGEEYQSPVFSCYDDAITIECDWETDMDRPDGYEVFPEILAWAEVPT